MNTSSPQPAPAGATPGRRRSPGSCALRLVVFLVLGCVAGWWFLRERWTSETDISLADGQTLLVRKSGSEWRYFGLGHGMGGFGGGGFRQELEFTHDGTKYSWDGNSEPIVLQMDDGHPVLVTFDRETNFAKITFRYFRHEGKWQELPLTSFPPRLAIQNMWLGDDAKLIRRADPADSRFRRSLMAKLRYCIIHGTQYWELERRDIEQKFLEDYAREPLAR